MGRNDYNTVKSVTPIDQMCLHSTPALFPTVAGKVTCDISIFGLPFSQAENPSFSAPRLDLAVFLFVVNVAVKV